VDDAIPPERPAPQPPPPAPWQRPDQPPPGVPSTYPAAPGESTQTGQPQGWGQQGTTQWGQPTWGGPYGGAGQPGAPPPPGLPPGQPPGWGPGGWQQARPKPGIIPLRPISLLEIYDGAWEVTMRATHAAEGTIAHHHGIGRVRKQWLRVELGEAYDTLVRIKQAIDPNNVMNPGALLDVR